MTPGTVVTARLSGGVGAEKDKHRPALVAQTNGTTTLVLAITDAQKRRIPTHALLSGYTSGTQVKDALVTCEHAWFLDPARLEPREGARTLTGEEMGAVGRCLHLALGLAPSRPPPQPPRFFRGSILEIDFRGGVGVELSDRRTAVVLSNDAGNYFGRTLLVAPFVEPAVVGIALPEGLLDLGRLRVVDVDRIQGGVHGTIGADGMRRIEVSLQDLLPTAQPRRRRRRRGRPAPPS